MQTVPDRSHRPSREDSGFILVALIATVIPVLGLALAATATMGGRNDELGTQIKWHRAKLAAESGIDKAIYFARSGQLVPGTQITGGLGNGMTFTADPVHWLTDGIDNDGDTAIDEADEDILEVTVTGSYRATSKRLSVTFAMAPAPRVPSALYVDSPATDLKGDITGYWISGDDLMLSGSTPSQPANTLGVSVSDVGTFLAGLTTETTTGIQGIASEDPNSGGFSVDNPSISLDLNALLVHAQANATLTLAPGTFSGTFGDSSTNSYELVICNGNLTLGSGFRGAGVLVVTGKLDGTLWQSFDGVILSMGDLKLQDCPTKGSIMTASSCNKVEMFTSYLDYSSEVLDGVTPLLPAGWLGPAAGGAPVFTFRGWESLTN